MLLVAHRTPRSRVDCERLAAAGAGVFEIDVQVDPQDRLVVSHFLPFGRLGLVQHDNWRLRWHTGASLDPQLADLVAFVPDDCQVLLDLKEDAAERRARLVVAIAGASLDPRRFVVCGPRPDDLQVVRAAGLRTWRTVGDRRELRAVLGASEVADDAVTVRHSLLSRDVVDRLRAVATQVVAWTINDVRRARELAGLGVDGVTTDRPAVLRQLAASPH